MRLLVRSKAEAKFAASYLKRAACDLKRCSSWCIRRIVAGRVIVDRSMSRRAKAATGLAIVHFHFNAWAKYRTGSSTRKCRDGGKVFKRPLFDAQFNARISSSKAAASK